jgi:hypothetical protein
MSAIGYTYSVVRYVHDPAAGESLNLGIVLYAPSIPRVATRLEYSYARLTQAFSGFDGRNYRKTLRQFEAAIDRMQSSWTDSFPAMRKLPEDAGAIGSQIWPDTDLSFRLGPVWAGVTSNFEETLQFLFDRFVTFQHAREHEERRSDKDVWTAYHQRLTQTPIASSLRKKRFTTPEVTLEFEHAFQNGGWHVLQPISLDYSRAEAIQEKATRWLGKALALKDHEELKQLYVLLGRPQMESLRDPYCRAKALLEKMPVPHVIVEEHEAEEFARKLAEFVQAHGVIDSTSAR